MNHHEIQVSGMSCNHCINAIKDALADLDPQAQVHVDLQGGLVVVDSEQPLEALRNAIVEAGYAVP
ncbi:heavy-metal-associated domain-containing protein [Variovorax dokdonensis]|uniref:Heavy-metal-associated domain-containing protein n=1 Tax=Variovorax dokdonensis TaxID=344883 RepID=A0ABT7NFZ2_9BURK|nr:heavy-metal-associated domain-containing protein [Variovorax dokdonensis]MDM0046745.1 heavy-metal-associated domain-containing protein [Variovorax dokdonensis]